MEKKIKVLMVVFNLSVANGVSSYVMNYFRNLDHNKIIMDFVVYQDVETPYSKEIIDNGVIFLRFHLSRIFILI